MAIIGLRRIIRNAVSILTSDVFNRAATFVMYLLVARYLGAFEFGQVSLALSYFYVFQILAVAGLKTLLTREIARDRAMTDLYLVNGSVVVVVFSLISIITLFLFVWLMGYTEDTASIIVLLALALLPYSLSAICEAVFQAWERMHYIAYANVPANIVKVSLAFIILSQRHGVYHIMILITATHLAVIGIEWLLMSRYITRPRMRVDLRFSTAMTRKTVTFLGIDSTIAIWSSMNIILLSKLASEKEVGLFSAASQLMVPLILIFQSVVASVFPIMCKKMDSGYQSLRRITEHLIELLLVIAFPVAIGLFFQADAALLLLYGGKEFQFASIALRIMVWGLIMSALTFSLGQVLLAGLRERVTLRIVAINTLLNLGLALILISRFGLVGAATAALLTRIVNFFQHYIPVSRLLSKLALGRLAWKPVVSSLCMAAYLALTRDQRVFLTALTAGVIYVGVLLLLLILSTGGLYQFRAKYQNLWSQ